MVTILLILLTIGTYYLVRDVFHPAFIMLFFWTIGFFLMGILPGFYFPSLETQVIIASYLIIFSLFSLLISFMIHTHNIKDFVFNVSIDYQFFNFLMLISILFLSYYIVQRVIIISNYDSLRAYFFYIRSASLEGEPLVATSSIMHQMKTLSVVLSFVAFFKLITLNNTLKMKLFLYVYIFFVLFSSIIEGARSEFIMIVFVFMSMYIVSKGSKKILNVIGIFLILFFFISMYTRGGELLNSDTLSAIGYFIEHLLLYAFGSISSFESFLTHDISVSSSIMVTIIDKTNSIVNLFGFNNILQHQSIEQVPFVNISQNLETNVYSFLSVRIFYFGFFGAVLFTIFHALIMTIVYKYFRKNIIMYFVYMLMIVSTVLSLFHEYFYAYLPYYIRIVFFIFLLYYLKPIVMLKKQFNHRKVIIK